MDRLTTKIFRTDKDYTLKCTCAFTQTKEGTECTVESCTDFCDLQDDCNTCGIQIAVNCLAAYEDTGLTPKEIVAMKADNKRLHDLIDILESAINAH